MSPGATPTEGGNALRNALAMIASPSATNPWLLKLEPGSYDVGSAGLSIPAHVDVEGSGTGT